MDDEKLILLVQSNEHIYNKCARDFKLVDKKKEAWSNIAQILGQTDENCMRRWTSLRDRYVREKRLENQVVVNSGSSSFIKYRWPFMELMEFLAPHIAPTRPKRNYNTVKEESDVSLPLSEEILEEIEQPATESQPSYSPLPSPIEQSPISEPEIILTKKRKRNLEESIETDQKFSEAVEAFKRICKTREEKARQLEEAQKEANEPLYSFGKMIMATIGSLSDMKQAKAMQQVTNVVMKIKMETQTELNEIIHEFIPD